MFPDELGLPATITDALRGWGLPLPGQWTRRVANGWSNLYDPPSRAMATIHAHRACSVVIYIGAHLLTRVRLEAKEIYPFAMEPWFNYAVYGVDVDEKAFTVCSEPSLNDHHQSVREDMVSQALATRDGYVTLRFGGRVARIDVERDGIEAVELQFNGVEDPVARAVARDGRWCPIRLSYAPSFYRVDSARLWITGGTGLVVATATILDHSSSNP